MAKNEKMFLWWGSGSGPCWKPMLVLAEKGMWEGCPNKLIEFSKKEHKGEEVTKVNPRGQVPTFKDGDVIVNESGAICMYLEEKYSDDSNKLMPSDVKERAKVYQIMFESANVQKEIMEKLVYYRWRTKKEDWDEEYLKENTEKAKKELDIWNAILGDHEYMCGKNFTMADVFFFPQLAFLVRSGATLSGQSALKKYYDRVCERQSVKDTWPPHWKNIDATGMLSDL